MASNTQEEDPTNTALDLYNAHYYIYSTPTTISPDTSNASATPTNIPPRDAHAALCNEADSEDVSSTTLACQLAVDSRQDWFNNLSKVEQANVNAEIIEHAKLLHQANTSLPYEKREDHDHQEFMSKSELDEEVEVFYGKAGTLVQDREQNKGDEMKD